MVPTKRLVLEPFRSTHARLSSSSLKKVETPPPPPRFHLGYYVNPKLKRGVSLSLSLSLFELALTRHIYIVIAFVDCCGPTTRKKKKTKKTKKKKEEENFELSPLPVTHNERQSRLFFFETVFVRVVR